jgi:hypothetical protein
MTEFLYGLPGAERFFTDPAECFETEIDPCDATRMSHTWIIEKWTALPARDYLPDPGYAAEQVAERAADDMGIDGVWDDHWGKACVDTEVIEAYRAAGELMASKVSWLMCGEKVGAHTVTWSEDGSPLLDGQPMYVPTTDAVANVLTAADAAVAGAEEARQRNQHRPVQIVAGEGATRATIGRGGVIIEDGDILHVLVDGYTVPFLYQRHEVRRIGDVAEVTS